MGRRRKGTRLRDPGPIQLWMDEAPTVHTLALLSRRTGILMPNLSAMKNRRQLPDEPNRRLLWMGSGGGIPWQLEHWIEEDTDRGTGAPAPEPRARGARGPGAPGA